MDEKERAKKDIEKLEKMIGQFKELGLAEKYPKVLEFAENYLHDAKHFYEKKQFFTAFGAANYAYGFIDAVLVIEGKRDERLF